VTFVFVYEISREPLNGFAPNSQGRRVWSLARMSLNIKVKGQGYHGQFQRPAGEGLCLEKHLCSNFTCLYVLYVFLKRFKLAHCDTF